MGNGCCKGGKKIDLISSALCQFGANVRFGKAADASTPILSAQRSIHIWHPSTKIAWHGLAEQRAGS